MLMLDGMLLIRICCENFKIQASLVIRGRYVPVFWTSNIEFADKKTADNEVHLYSQTQS